MPTAVITPENLSADFLIDSADPSGKPVRINLGDGLFRKNGKVAVDATKTGMTFPDHPTAMAWLSAYAWPNGISFRVGKARFITDNTETGVAGLPGAAPNGRVTPYHWSQTPAPADILAAWAWYCGKTSTTPNNLNPNSARVGNFHFPRGKWGDEATPITLATTGTGQSITGEGGASVLWGITIRVGDRRCNVSGLSMDGLLRTCDGIVVSPRDVAGFREGTIDNIRILNRNIGIGFYGNNGHMNITRLWVSRCNLGRFIEQQVGNSFSNCDFLSNYGHGTSEQWGGEIREVRCRFLGNAGYGIYVNPLPGGSYVECYRDNVSCSGNQTGPDQSGLANRLSWPITSIANNGAGKVRVTLDLTSGPHHFFAGQRVTSILGTGIYDGDVDVLSATNTTVDLDVAYTANAVGTLRHPGYDVWFHGDPAETIQRINDQFFTACNINNMYVQRCYNFQFTGNRNKVSLYCKEVHNIGRIANGRGRDDATWGHVDIVGSNDGFAEILFGQPNAANFNDAGGGVVLQVPDATVPTVGNAVVARHSFEMDSLAGMQLKGKASLNGIPLEPYCGASGGTANALTLTSGMRLSGDIPIGTKIRFRATLTNTVTATIQLDNCAAILCRTVTGAVLPAGYLRTDVDTEASYNGTHWIVRRAPEYGTGADGSYSRLENGLQTCVSQVLPQADITTATGSMFRTAAEAFWNFPMPFDDTVRVNVSAANRAAVLTHWVSARVISATQAGYAMFSPVSVTARGAQLNASGFWY